MANRNSFWAKTFVDELARCGLKYACIAPGSRSTPLVIAFAENPHIQVYSHIDERSCAFFALGLALATDQPVAILCSSGTATANFHPAVIEARYANVPLLVLTADRQHELRESGANQTVDQVKMFGDHVLWFYDVALPEAQPPAVAVRNLRTLADRAYAKANGIEKGPVHLNFPFRKPLEPTPVSTDVLDVEPHLRGDTIPHTLISRGELRPSRDQLQQIVPLINAAKRPLIMCGPRFDGRDEQFTAFANATGYPIFADTLSGARFNPALRTITTYDTLLAGEVPFEQPDLILHFGAMPASAALENYLNRIDTPHRILITENGVWTDAYHRLSVLIQASPSITCDLLRRFATPTLDEAWAAQVYAAEAACREQLDTQLESTLFDGAAVWQVMTALNDHAESDARVRHSVFCASSLPVRHLEQYTPTLPNIARVFSSRGASGIDGTISSALGVAAALAAQNTEEVHHHVTLLIGDLAFYHDMNGLLALSRCNITNITIVLVNNDGGGIFQRLPVSQFDPPFTDLFLTPHGLDFEPAVRMYGLDYHRVKSLAMLREQVIHAVDGAKPAVIEVRTDSKRDLERREEINHAIQQMFQFEGKLKEI